MAKHRKLFSRCYGYRLYEPSIVRADNIFPGDVGLFFRGDFHPLFNAMLPANHPINQKSGVPAKFNLFAQKQETAEAYYLSDLIDPHSPQEPGVQEKKLSLHTQDKSRDNKMRLVRRTVVCSDATVEDYMMRNLEEWHKFATGDVLDVALRRSAIVLVTEVVEIMDGDSNCDAPNDGGVSGRICGKKYSCMNYYKTESRIWHRLRRDGEAICSDESKYDPLGIREDTVYGQREDCGNEDEDNHYEKEEYDDDEKEKTRQLSILDYDDDSTDVCVYHQELC